MEPIILVSICVAVLTVVISAFFIYLIIILTDIRFILKDTIKKMEKINNFVDLLADISIAVSHRFKNLINFNKGFYSLLISIFEIIKLFYKKRGTKYDK
jgi:hypothetical protein